MGSTKDESPLAKAPHPDNSQSVPTITKTNWRTICRKIPSNKHPSWCGSVTRSYIVQNCLSIQLMIFIVRTVIHMVCWPLSFSVAIFTWSKRKQRRDKTPQSPQLKFTMKCCCSQSSIRQVLGTPRPRCSLIQILYIHVHTLCVYIYIINNNKCTCTSYIIHYYMYILYLYIHMYAFPVG